ncbi:hypothetical protein H310_10989 [Aphanomyces invadans]|uniref:Uncharacterized protein n=1 Tax=Aphanomyces invadans TaxID=157072 RepID=A0A024TN11_9STRA|nr:hypothetical protein H310_10989 [Aphanomyces invadans]ETV95545.1 hypothetical protein H310_10989 [Aphanomyces invadans]|eukprot:XP_008875738.1 hypothetical protein H310_10989 [Aphanomyces invadans]
MIGRIDDVDTRLGAVALLLVGSKADSESLHDDVAEICGELHHVHEKLDAVAAQKLNWRDAPPDDLQAALGTLAAVMAIDDHGTFDSAFWFFNVPSFA